jgi:hypothetical protein
MQVVVVADQLMVVMQEQEVQVVVEQVDLHLFVKLV